MYLAQPMLAALLPGNFFAAAPVVSHSTAPASR
jgi:hypothetical protein